MLQAKESQIQLAEFRRTVWQMEVPSGTKLADVIQPEYWRNVSGRLKRNDRIEVSCEDGSWRADLAVEGVGRMSAHVTVMHAVESKGAAADPAGTSDSRYDVAWGGPAHKWRIIRKSDNEVIAHGYTSQSDAWEAVPALDQRAA